MDYTKLAAAPDGSGGAIIVWTDYAESANDSLAQKAQRVDSAGVSQWSANGVAVCTGPVFWQMSPVAAADGAGGAIVAWLDSRISQFHVFVQRIDGDGQTLWASNGQAVDSTPDGQLDPAIVSDGSGGAFVSWWSYPSSPGKRKVQRILGGGATAWNTGNTLLSAGETWWVGGNMVADGVGGVICTWLRDSTKSLMAQRIDCNGNQLWNAGGILVTAVSHRYSGTASPAVSDGTGDLITAWGQAGASDFDLFAQRVGTGAPILSTPVKPTPARLAVSVAPNPSRGGATVLFAASAEATKARASILDLHGRLVRDLGVFPLSPGNQAIQWDGLDRSSRPVGPGVYFARLASREGERVVRFAVVR
jgi:hypothetical protein